MNGKISIIRIKLSLVLCATTLSWCLATVPDGWNLPATTISSLLPGYTSANGTVSSGIDGSGNVMATWIAEKAGNYYFAVARYESSVKAWSPHVYTMLVPSAAVTPALQMSLSGDAFISWYTGNSPFYINITKLRAELIGQIGNLSSNRFSMHS